MKLFISTSVLHSTSVHWTDLYPKQFKELRKKYLKQATKSYLYLQFTNHAFSDLHKTAHKNTDHSDPVGIYGYPLAYVLKYPADVWYGQAATYVRVIEERANKILHVQELNTESRALDFVSKITQSVIEAENQLKLARKYIRDNFRITGNLWAKAAWACLQSTFLSDKNNTKIVRDIRTSEQQTKILLQLGYDAVLDDARQFTAVINDREPEQIIFLKRNAFKVIETYQLRNKPTSNLVTQTDEGELAKVLASKILYALGTSRAKENTSNTGQYKFWGKNGYSVEVNMLYTSHYIDTHGFGEKKHKESKLYNPKHTTVTVTTDRGEFTHDYGPDKTFDQIAEDIKQFFAKKPIDPNWEPDSYQKYLQRQEDAKKARNEAILKKEYDESEQDRPELEKSINELATKLGTPTVDLSDLTGKDISRLSSEILYAARVIAADKPYEPRFNKPVKYIEKILPTLTALKATGKDLDSIIPFSMVSSSTVLAIRFFLRALDKL